MNKDVPHLAYTGWSEIYGVSCCAYCSGPRVRQLSGGSTIRFLRDFVVVVVSVYCRILNRERMNMQDSIDYLQDVQCLDARRRRALIVLAVALALSAALTVAIPGILPHPVYVRTDAHAHITLRLARSLPPLSLPSRSLLLRLVTCTFART